MPLAGRRPVAGHPQISHRENRHRAPEPIGAAAMLTIATFFWLFSFQPTRLYASARKSCHISIENAACRTQLHINTLPNLHLLIRAIELLY